MHPMVRDLYHSVMDGSIDLAPLLFQINHHDRALEILAWLRRNNLTGLNLMAFWMGDCERSFLGVIQFVVKHLEGEAKTRAVLASEFGVKRP